MQRQARRSAADGEWISVSTTHPCAVCGARDGCRSGYDGRFACCLHCASEWPLTPGGWLHRLGAETERAPAAPDDHVVELLTT